MRNREDTRKAAVLNRLRMKAAAREVETQTRINEVKQRIAQRSSTDFANNLVTTLTFLAQHDQAFVNQLKNDLQELAQHNHVAATEKIVAQEQLTAEEQALLAATMSSTLDSTKPRRTRSYSFFETIKHPQLNYKEYVFINIPTHGHYYTWHCRR